MFSLRNDICDVIQMRTLACLRAKLNTQWMVVGADARCRRYRCHYLCRV